MTTPAKPTPAPSSDPTRQTEVCVLCGATPVLAHPVGDPAYCVDCHPDPEANLEKHGK